MDVCAYAGTGNVLKVQEMLHICSEHYEKEEQKDEVFDLLNKYSFFNFSISLKLKYLLVLLYLTLQRQHPPLMAMQMRKMLMLQKHHQKVKKLLVNV